MLALVELRHRPYVANAQVFVSVVPVAGAPEGTASSFESESRQVAIDLSQVLSGRSIADKISAGSPGQLTPQQVQSDLSGSADNRVLTITATAPSQTRALNLAQAATKQLETNRPAYLGRFEASRTVLTVVSPPSTSRTSARHVLLAMLIRIVLGAIVAVGVALAIEYFELGPTQTTANSSSTSFE